METPPISRYIVYCPECGAEYREGFTECSDCRVALVWQKPPESEPEPPELDHAPPLRGDPDLQLVTVLESSDPMLIAAARGLLEDAAIPFYVLGDEVGALYAMTGHGVYSQRRVQVGSDREAEARVLLQSFTETGGPE